MNPGRPKYGIRLDSAELTVFACGGVPRHYSGLAMKDKGIEMSILMVILAIVHGQDKLVGLCTRRADPPPYQSLKGGQQTEGVLSQVATSGRCSWTGLGVQSCLQWFWGQQLR